MLQRLANSWNLVKASAAVLRADKELLVFPLVSSVAALLVTATFLVPSYLAGLWSTRVQGAEDIPAMGYVVLFLFYLCSYAVTFYFNTALVGAALIRLRGGDPTLRDGFGIANRHLGNILGYAAISATVGVVLMFVSDRAGKGGQALGRIGGLAWTIATFLVVPVLVAEGLGPLAAVRRSAALLRRTWGEQIVGGAGIGIVFTLAFLLTVALGVTGTVAAAASGIPALIVVVVALFVLALVGLGLVQGALGGVYTAAVYRYALGESIGAFFPNELVADAFRSQ